MVEGLVDITDVAWTPFINEEDLKIKNIDEINSTEELKAEYEELCKKTKELVKTYQELYVSRDWYVKRIKEMRYQMEDSWEEYEEIIENLRRGIW